MAIRIQLRRDTGANWAAANTVLADGELGINSTTGQIKIGDGTTAWNNLSYAATGPTGPAGESALHPFLLMGA